MTKFFLYAICFIINLSLNSNSKAQIIINEVMPNPNKGKLPEYEYLEIYNKSDTPIQLANYSLLINKNKISLTDYILAPKQYLILCNEAASLSFDRYGNVLPLRTWYPLPNIGAKITLISSSGEFDELEYKNSWHEEGSNKKNGGWSLERINPDWTCSHSSNWTSSYSPNGGTPGRQNSVLNKKAEPEVFINSSEIDKNVLKLTFNLEYVHMQNFTVEDFNIDKGIGSPKQLQWNDSQDTLNLFFTKQFQEDEIYSLQIQAINVCFYEVKIEDEVLFKQSNIKNKAVIISEILFNPKDGGVDFVEIYNSTDYPINIQNWRLTDRVITRDFYILSAYEYLAITTNKSIIHLQYPTSPTNNVIQATNMPAYPNLQGNVILFSQNGVQIDSTYYHANMHDPQLTNVKGISLERQSMNENNSLFNKWNSSSTLLEGATPGYQNASSMDILFKKNNFFLRSKTVSSNSDTHENSLELNYQFISSEYYINISIYNDKGTLINRLIRNQKAGTEGKILWDIRNENGQKVNAGHYIVIAEIYNRNGQKERFKEAFIVVPNTLAY